MRKLKVFGATIVDWKRQFPGNQSRQVRGIVAVTSKKAAAAAFEMTLGELNGYGGETANQAEIETATASPGVVFIRPLDSWKSPFVKRISRSAAVAGGRET